jgi:AAA domain
MFTPEEMNKRWAETNQAHVAKRFKLLSIKDLEDLPPPTWLIDGIIEDNVLGVLYGGSGDGKSFVALDYALSIASDVKWQGRGVTGGQVVYVVAEGGRGIKKRVDAWIIANRVSAPTDMFLILDAVQFTDPAHVDALLSQIQERAIAPRLIIIDTLARCFNGDENSSKEMGEFIAACSQVKQRTGATVLAIHHTGKVTTKGERGSSALRAAADVMIRVSKDHSIVKIDVDKQKDDEPITGIRLRLTQVVVGRDDLGNELTSCILTPDGDLPPLTPTLPIGASAALQTLLFEFDGEAESGAWRRGIRLASGKEMAEETFHRHKRTLLKERSIEQAEGRAHCYRITEAGTVTAKTLPLACQRQLPNGSAATATPPMGVAGGTGEAESSSVPREATGTAADEMPAVVEPEDGDAGR